MNPLQRTQTLHGMHRQPLGDACEQGAEARPKALGAPPPRLTKGTGSIKVWRRDILAMAAGLTDHVSLLKEVWHYRVLPWSQPQAVEEAVQGNDHGVEQLTCAQRGSETWTRGCTHVASAENRLTGTTQTGRERSEPLSAELRYTVQIRRDPQICTAISHSLFRGKGDHAFNHRHSH